MSFFSEIAQIGNCFLSKGLGVLTAVNEDINESVQTLRTDDGKGFAEFFERTDAAAKKMSVSQFHDATVDKTSVELSSIFLASAQSANELAH